jgi:hypothetical protein
VRGFRGTGVIPFPARPIPLCHFGGTVNSVFPRNGLALIGGSGGGVSVARGRCAVGIFRACDRNLHSFGQRNAAMCVIIDTSAR